MGARDYSTTAASNLSVGGISIAEGMARSSVNNAIRQELADIADLLLDLGGATTTTGSANAYLLALDSGPTSYADNLFFLAKLNHMNSGAATLNLNSIGVKDVKKFIIGDATPAALDPGDMHVGHIGIFVYSSAANAFLLLNPTTSEMIGTNVAIFETRSAAEAAHLPASVGMLETMSFATRGDGGGARYKRVTGPSTYVGDFDSADGAWWEHAPSGALRLAEWGVFKGNASLDGSGVWSGTDQEPAIKGALFRSIYQLKGDYPYLPIGNLFVGRGLHMGYGDIYRGGALRGPQRNYNHEDYPATALVWNFTDEPLLSIAGGRATNVENVSFSGPGLKYLLDNNIGQIAYDGAAGDDTLIDTWYPPAWRGVQASSRYAPSAVIAIDPRYGPSSPSSLTSKYRDIDFPSEMSPMPASSYNLNARTTEVLIENFNIYGGASVAVVVHPNEASDGNGDFIRMEHGNISWIPVGLSVSQSQARLTLLDSVDFLIVHTAITTNMHGKQLGVFAEARNCHFGGIQIFNLTDMSYTGHTVINGYGEALWRLGDVTAVTEIATKLILNQLKLSFELQSDPGMVAVPLSTRGVPATMIGGGGSSLPLEINGGEWTNYSGAAVIDHNVVGVEINGLTLQPRPPLTMQEKCMHNGTAGGLIFPQLGYATPIENIHPKFIYWNLDTGAATLGRILNRVWQSNRTLCTPLWTQRHGAGPGTIRDEGVPIPERVQAVIAGGSFASFSLSGLTLTVTMAAYWTDAMYMAGGPLPGDVLYHPASKSVFVCMTANTTTDVVTFKLVNNFKGTTPRNPIDMVTDTLFYLGCTRYYSPAMPVYGIVTSGSAVITEAGRYPNGGGAQLGASLATDLAVGDWLVVDPSLAPYLNQSLCNITAINAGAATITLGGGGAAIASTVYVNPGTPPPATLPLRVRLGTFVRPGVS